MSIYGIGAYYDGVDVSDDFLTTGYACIGYNKNEASSLYEMLRRIKIGSIVYIKSFVNGTLYIKGIGWVKGRDIIKVNDTLGYGREVFWIAPLSKKSWIKIKLSKEDMKNNVYNNTLYEEYSNEIINKIWNTIEEF
jgi:hypothetical protein